MLVAAAPGARAHSDPSGCSQTGVGITLSIFRADGTTGVVGFVSQCETIIYQARLAKSQDISSICAFSGAPFSLTTPDGVNHVISANVPCIGGDGLGEGCDATRDFLDSDPIPYTVRTQDIDASGFITATAQYGIGVVHDNTPNTPGATATTPKATPIARCIDNNLCTNDVCDPAKQAGAACSFPPKVCTDNNLCTADTCNASTGACAFPPNVVCNDNNLCTADACNPATGTCTFTPNVVCNDNNPCTTEACNPATGQCVSGAAIVCDDHNLCTTDTCNPANGGCAFTTTVTCTDNNPCTNEQCNPATGQCVFTPSTSCDDRDPCTDDRCDPTIGCVNTPNNIPGCNQLHHFQCYEVKPAVFERRDVTVEDRYGTTTVNVRATNRLCAPSDKRGEDPIAPQTPQHLAGFPTKSDAFRLGQQVVTNQFGTLTLDIKRRVFLMVPTAKDLESQPPALLNPTSHFQCYLVKRSSGSARFERIADVPTVDQFGPHVVDLIRPKYLCVPADKNGEDPTAPSGQENLLCYKAKQHVRLGTRQPFMTNQFLSRREQMIRNLEFCVPTTFGPGND
jgi:hypothetical protein